MKKIIYTRPDGGVSIVSPAPKKDIERMLGSITDKEYEKLVLSKSIPEDAVNVRFIEDQDIPDDREFRDAWVDTEEGSQIDICCARAKDVALNRMRGERNRLLAESDRDFMIKFERGEDLTDVKKKKKSLRDVTEGLKSLEVDGKVNDEKILGAIGLLSSIPEELK